MQRWWHGPVGSVWLLCGPSWLSPGGPHVACAQSSSEAPAQASESKPQSPEPPPGQSTAVVEGQLQADAHARDGQAPDDAASASDPPGYRKAIDEAIREFSDHNFVEARALFARAHELSPSARTERGLGMAEFELKNYGACVMHLEAALASPVRPLSEKLRADTERMLERANAFVARYVLDARPAVSSVKLDGLAVELRPGRVLLVKVGEHVIELSAQGYQPERRRISVKTGGEQRTLSIVFAKPVEREQPAEHAAPARRWYKSPWLWTAVAVAAAGGATGTALGLHNRDPGTAPANGGSSNTVLGSP